MGQLEEPLVQEFSNCVVHQNHLRETLVKKKKKRIFLGFTPSGSDLGIFILELRCRWAAGHITKHTP